MSVLLFIILAPLATSIEEAAAWRIKAARLARRLPKRARRYRFT